MKAKTLHWSYAVGLLLTLKKRTQIHVNPKKKRDTGVL